MAGMRYGKHVEGAGVHHNPTPGPADGEWMYGHNWVSLCFLAAHPLWGVNALPLRSMLYVRVVDIPAIAEKHGWEFRTKHQLAVELVSWFVITARSIGLTCKIRLVADGAYAARPLIEIVRQYKTFLATSRLSGGVIRVVLVRFADGGWTAYFCTDPEISARDILETVAARWAIKEHFHDVKEVWGAGEQQVCNLWSNIGCIVNSTPTNVGQ